MAGLDDLVADDGQLAVPGIGHDIGGLTNKELMLRSRISLSGCWGLAILGYLLYGLLIASITVFAVALNCFVYAVGAAAGKAVGLPVYATLAVSLVLLLLTTGPFVVGWYGFFLSAAREGRPNLERLFVGFRRFFKSVGGMFLYTLFVLLWTLLLVVPGVIAMFRYAMAFFVLADEEDCGALEAIRRSKEMMKGNKGRFFCLYWRFFWWGLLGLLTGGIGFLWLIPYMQTSFGKFYEDVK